MSEPMIQQMENPNQIENVVKVVNTILLSSNNKLVGGGGSNVLQELDGKLQKSYKECYEKSGIKDMVEGVKGLQDSDDKALQIVSEEASMGKGGWISTFPNMRPDGQGMDCTLATAILHAGLEELGYDDVRSTLRSGHYVVSRVLPNGGLKIYDPATTITKNGETSGYSRVFSSREFQLIDVEEGSGKKGAKIELTIDKPDLPGGFREPDPKDGKYKQILYASPPTTLLDLSVALENIDSLRNDAEGISTEDTVQSETQPDVWRDQAKLIVESNPEISDFSHDRLKRQLNFFDPYDVIKNKL